MSDKIDTLPEAIAAWRFHPNKADEWLHGGWSEEHDRKTTRYIRADLHDALAVERDALRAENERLRQAQAALAARVAEVERNPCAPLESAVLAALPGQEENSDFGFEFYHGLAVIAVDAGVDKEAARFACRRLRDRGLAVYRSGLFTEDGEVAGAGYALTDAGRAALSSGTDEGEG